MSNAPPSPERKAMAHPKIVKKNATNSWRADRNPRMDTSSNKTNGYAL
jgi:hypothetical protein